MSTVGFVGLGNMGHPMALNLRRAGHTVLGFDVSEQARQSAAEAGLSIATDAAAVAEKADVVVTMLQNGDQVHRVYGGRQGVLAAAAPGTLFIDCSTIAPADAQEAQRMAVAAGHRAVDAPVSGGVTGAVAGTLTLMVGGSDDDFSTADEVLRAVGTRVVHCGSSGAGQAAKLCNNLILAISMIGVSEAFVLGEALGLTHQALFDVVSQASGQCWALTTNCPVPGPVPTSPANRDFEPGFTTALMVKDLGLAAAAMESTGVEAGLGSLARALYERFASDGGSALDFSAIIGHFRMRSSG